jgi:hypothetical protein
MMIPGQWEGGPRAATAVTVSLPSTIHPHLTAEVPTRPRPSQSQTPAWLSVTLFASMLLAVSWLVMWLEAASR